jgi:hypothetical protein
MPLNESSGPQRSNLTKEQKGQAMAAIFGLQERPMAVEGLTAQDIEKMRTLVAQHDSGQKMQEFDLNNPPRAQYVHKEFPKMVYHHESRKHQVVKSAEHLELAIEAGYQTEPFVAEAEPVQLDSASAREAAAVDAQLAEANRKKKGTK